MTGDAVSVWQRCGQGTDWDDLDLTSPSTITVYELWTSHFISLGLNFLKYEKEIITALHHTDMNIHGDDSCEVLSSLALCNESSQIGKSAIFQSLCNHANECEDNMRGSRAGVCTTFKMLLGDTWIPH